MRGAGKVVSKYNAGPVQTEEEDVRKRSTAAATTHSETVTRPVLSGWISRRFLPPPEQRCGVSVQRAVYRIVLSSVRPRLRRLTVVPVDIGGAEVNADLRTSLGLRLYRYGFCEPEARVCAALLHPGDVFVDGGANVGLFALRGAAVVGPTGRVLACEPGPGTMELLRANAGRNSHPSLELHEIALSDYEGRAHFTVFEDGSGLASFAPQAGGGRNLDVTVTTLDNLTVGFADRVSLVKLDVEGAETKALRGAAELIKRSEPVFIVEVEPGHLARQGSSVEDLMAVMQPLGYAAYSITPNARLSQLEGPWRASDPARPNLVLASQRRLGRLRGLLTTVG